MVELRRLRLTKTQAVKKVEIAIDKLVDLQEGGFGCDTVTRVLEMLNALTGEIENQEAN
jgi:hypothetical protein